jgi:hypothetical protein
MLRLFARLQMRENHMSAVSVGGRTMKTVDELFDAARSFANGSNDPSATYEAFLRGLEMGLAYGSLDPIMRKTIGNRLADLRPHGNLKPELTHGSANTLEYSPRPTTRVVPKRLVVKDSDFPTEWTLEP